MTDIETKFDAKEFAVKYIEAMKNPDNTDKLISLPDELTNKEDEAAALAAILEIAGEQGEDFQSKYGELLSTLKDVVREEDPSAVELAEEEVVEKEVETEDA